MTLRKIASKPGRGTIEGIREKDYGIHITRNVCIDITKYDVCLCLNSKTHFSQTKCGSLHSKD